MLALRNYCAQRLRQYLAFGVKHSPLDDVKYTTVHEVMSQDSYAKMFAPALDVP